MLARFLPGKNRANMSHIMLSRRPSPPARVAGPSSHVKHYFQFSDKKKALTCVKAFARENRPPELADGLRGLRGL
jgi:hypothetical protein